MMARRVLLLVLAGLALLAAMPARALTELDDETLSQSAARDGLSIIVHLDLNSSSTGTTSTSSTVNSSLTWGVTVNGQTNYAVMLNPHGIIDLYAITIDTQARPGGGGDVIVIGLPTYVSFQQFGFDALGIQSNPQAPISGDLGHVILDGQLSLQGQLRVWGK